MLKIFPVILLVLLIPPALVNFGFSQANPDDGTPTLTWAITSEVGTLDPQRTSALIDFRIIEAIYEPLLRVNPATVKLEPATAEALPVVSDDLRTFTYTIREDAKWSNGDPVRPEDFAYGWMRAVVPDLAAKYADFVFRIEGAKAFFDWRNEQLAQYASRNDESRDAAEAAALWEQAKARFEDTVGIRCEGRKLIVTMAEPSPIFPYLSGFATFMPIHRESAEAALKIDPGSGRITYDALYFAREDRMVTNGPYALTQWAFNRQLVIDANPHYWNADNVPTPRMVQRIIKDEALGLMLYEFEELDWLPNIPERAAKDMLATDRDDVFSTPAAGTYYYVINTRAQRDGEPNPLADPKIRMALSLAVDRKALVEQVRGKKEPAANTFVPPGSIPGYEPPTGLNPIFDPDRAKELLAEAGFPDGLGLRPLTLQYNTGGGHEEPATAIARMWQENLGVRVETKAVEWSRHLEMLHPNSADFDIARVAWFGDYPDPSTFLELLKSDGSNNTSGYHNPEFDRLFAEGNAVIDPAKRYALFREAETVMLKEQPIIPLFHYVTTNLYRPGVVKNMDLNMWGYRALHRIELNRE